MNPVIVIPARYKSSRFEGKPLATIKGKSMIERVWEQCSKLAGSECVYVATDDKKIEKFCKEKGIQSIMTSETCLTGTDRVYEFSSQVDSEVYINVQGDEPLISPDDIKKVIECSSHYPNEVVCGMTEIRDEEDFRSKSVPKVVTSPDGKLFYMSRAPIPTNKSHEFIKAWKQVCVYAFPKKLLDKFGEASQKTPLEDIEDIEILRFMEMGIPVRMIEVSGQSIAVDFPEDIKKVEAYLETHGEP